jgi:hypothetical protein
MQLLYDYGSSQCTSQQNVAVAVYVMLPQCICLANCKAHSNHTTLRCQTLVLSAVDTLCTGNTGRKFVARFSVFSEAVGWEGSTGPNTVLWCEYLTPWVLRKEVHTILKVSAYYAAV